MGVTHEYSATSVYENKYVELDKKNQINILFTASSQWLQ
jgi:hypothetical protein